MKPCCFSEICLLECAGSNSLGAPFRGPGRHELVSLCWTVTQVPLPPVSFEKQAERAQSYVKSTDQLKSVAHSWCYTWCAHRALPTPKKYHPSSCAPGQWIRMPML